MKPTSDAAVLRRVIAALILSATAMTLTACPYGTELENKEAFLGPSDGGGCDRAPQIFEMGCYTGICHESTNGQPPAGVVDLLSPGFEATLLDTDAAYPTTYIDNPEACPTDPEHIVDTTNPDNSLLIKKLRGTHACGARMPDDSGLDEADIACVEAWVKQLAAQGAP